MSDPAVFSAAALSVVLLVSGWSKLRAPGNFRRALGTYDAIPTGVVPFLAFAVPLTELSLAGMQWISPLQPAAWIGMCLMFGAFTLLLLRSLLIGEDADCGCFGSPVKDRVSWSSIVRNGVLIGLVVVGPVAGEGAGRGFLPAFLAGVGAGLLILVLDQTTAMFSRATSRPRP